MRVIIDGKEYVGKQELFDEVNRLLIQDRVCVNKDTEYIVLTPDRGQ